MLRKRYFWLVVVVCIGFLARLIAYGFIKVPWILYDEVVYLDSARQIIRGSFFSAIIRDQLYPPGWPMLLAAVGGGINNPFIQYKLYLLCTMLISSCIPLLIYRMTRSWRVSVAASMYPALFVYSSNIMSETFYTGLFILFVLCMRAIIRDDLRSRWHIIGAGIIMGFLVYSLRLVRSFGVVVLPSYLLTALIIVLLAHVERIPKQVKKGMIVFSAILTTSYFIFDFIGKKIIFTKHLYEADSYMKALTRGLHNPSFVFTLLQNEFMIILFSGLWILPLFFVLATVRKIHEKRYDESSVRIFIVSMLAFSLGLTIVHMLQTAHQDEQYLLFSRYIDPPLLLLFVYSLYDFIHYVKEKVRIPPVIFGLYMAVVVYFLWYLKNGFYLGQYKFGNNMSVYFLMMLKDSYIYALFALFIGVAFWLLYRNRKTELVWLVTGGVSMYFIIAISSTIRVPKYVQRQYVPVINKWVSGMNSDPRDKTVCIYEGYVSVDVFYQYHFLYPYRYLNNCGGTNKSLLRHIVIGQTEKKVTLPDSCRLELQFDTKEMLYYCPLGVTL